MKPLNHFRIKNAKYQFLNSQLEQLLFLDQEKISYWISVNIEKTNEIDCFFHSICKITPFKFIRLKNAYNSITEYILCYESVKLQLNTFTEPLYRLFSAYNSITEYILCYESVKLQLITFTDPLYRIFFPKKISI